MAIVELTTETFEQTIDDNEIVILDFWSPTCGPCLQFAPVFEKASEEHSDVVFGKINTMEQPDLARAFGIQAIPTIAVFRGQIPIFAQPGALPANVLEDLLQQVRDLDMDEVRAEYEKQIGEAS